MFALSCYGHQDIRPSITHGGAAILLLNRSLTYPGAWTVGGLVEAVAMGVGGKRIHRRASQHFAVGKKRSKNSMMRVFTYGAISRPAGRPRSF